MHRGSIIAYDDQRPCDETFGRGYLLGEEQSVRHIEERQVERTTDNIETSPLNTKCECWVVHVAIDGRLL